MNKPRFSLHESRIVALIVLAATIAYWFGALSLRDLPSYDAVGPAGFPILIASVATALGVLLLVKPQYDAGGSPLGRRVWICWFLFALYTVALPLIGFGISSVMFLASIFRLFKVSGIRAAIMSLLITGALWLLFARVLGLQLSLGPWK